MSETDVLPWQHSLRCPVVVAPLFSNLLQQAFPPIVQSLDNNADLVVSAILPDQWDETRAVAEKCGLTFTKITRKGKWMTARGYRTK